MQTQIRRHIMRHLIVCCLSQKLFPVVKMVEKQRGAPFYLKAALINIGMVHFMEKLKLIVLILLNAQRVCGVVFEYIKKEGIISGKKSINQPLFKTLSLETVKGCSRYNLGFFVEDIIRLSLT